MKRTVKLSQSELVDIIKRVIEENSINKETLSETAVDNEDELIPLIQNILQEQKVIQNIVQQMEQDDILVDASEISLNDQKCFRDATESEINATFNGKPKKPKYKVKRRGCSTTVKYIGPKVKYHKNNGY